jgi:hypothetical protein
MAGTAHGARTDPRDTIVLAIVLIAVGVGALAANALPGAGGWIVLIIGGALLATFAVTRHYGALVPGGIMSGLGAGIVASQSLALTDEGTGGVIVLGLGIGFLSIWLIGGLVHVAEHQPWPLIPGGILATIGGALLVGGQAVELLRYWPIVLIGLGVAALIRGFRGASMRRS